jgi:transcriptional regulator with XRE-family HTH domain
MPIDPQKIRTLREQRKLSLQEAATLAGLKTRQQWHNIESGERLHITADTLQAIARALGATMDDLMTDAAPKRPGRKGK